MLDRSIPLIQAMVDIAAEEAALPRAYLAPKAWLGSSLAIA